MIDIQIIGSLITAISVTCAAIYYITTVRINQRNSRIALTNNIMRARILYSYSLYPFERQDKPKKRAHLN